MTIVETFEDIATTSAAGEFKLQYFETRTLNKKIVVLSKNLNSKSNPIIRVQFGCFFGTTFDLIDCDCNLQVQESLKQIKDHDNGAFIYLPDDDGRGIGLDNKIKFLELQRKINEPPIKTAQRFHIKYEDFTTLTIIPELFKFLNINNEIILLTNSPQKTDYISKLGIRIKKTMPLKIEKKGLSERATKEMAEKKKILGHNL